MRALRLPLAILAAAAMAWIGWTIVQVTRADGLALVDPAAALAIDPDHPQALLRLARQQLAQKEYDPATETARHLLTVEPGQGEAFAIIALAALGRGDAQAAQLLEIAVHRAPRDVEVRTQAMVATLRKGDLEGGMEQLDAMLRLDPGRGKVLYPAMAQQTLNPRFTETLVATLAQSPPWRRAFLASVGRSESPEAMDRIYAGLQQRDALSEAEVRRWLNRKLRDGRWGEAYAHWIGTLDPVPQRLPPVYNGGFEQAPSSKGFDWHETRVTGVFSTLEPAPGATGERAAHFHFIGRPAPGGDLRQPLMLAPGRHALSLRARAEFLHSERGLQWIIRCDGGKVIARLGPLEGSFDWREVRAEFDVPVEKCPGQWLELHNPAVRGTAQQVTGDLWTDDIRIAAL